MVALAYQLKSGSKEPANVRHSSLPTNLTEIQPLLFCNKQVTMQLVNTVGGIDVLVLTLFRVCRFKLINYIGTVLVYVKYRSLFLNKVK